MKWRYVGQAAEAATGTGIVHCGSADGRRAGRGLRIGDGAEWVPLGEERRLKVFSSAPDAEELFRFMKEL